MRQSYACNNVCWPYTTVHDACDLQVHNVRCVYIAANSCIQQLPDDSECHLLHQVSPEMLQEVQDLFKIWDWNVSEPLSSLDAMAHCFNDALSALADDCQLPNAFDQHLVVLIDALGFKGELLILLCDGSETLA